MLTWKRKCCSDIYPLENFTVAVETLDCIINAAQCGVRYDILTDEVAKFKECVKCAHDIIWDITFYCRNINLMDLVTRNEKYPRAKQTNLHQCLGIITGPLFESLALQEAMEASKRRYSSNTIF